MGRELITSVESADLKVGDTRATWRKQGKQPVMSEVLNQTSMEMRFVIYFKAAIECVVIWLSFSIEKLFSPHLHTL